MSSRPSAFALSQPGRLRLYSSDELVKMPPPVWHIEGLFPKGGMVVLYGPPGSYKSFVAASFACAIGSNQPWLGRDALGGHALYCAAEGGSGMGKRIAGWSARAGIDPESINISWMLESFPMQADSTEMMLLLKRIIEIDAVPDLVVIDTLARCYVGDENKQEDMNAFVAGIDLLRDELKATVIVVHHTRLDGDRERGNTALRGAASAMLSVKPKNANGRRLVTLVNDKQKDDEENGGIVLALEKDETYNTLIVSPFVHTSGDRLLAALRQAGAQPGDVLRFTAMKKVTGWHKQALTRALDVTCQKGQIIKENDGYRISQVTS